MQYLKSIKYVDYDKRDKYMGINQIIFMISEFCNLGKYRYYYFLSDV